MSKPNIRRGQDKSQHLVNQSTSIGPELKGTLKDYSKEVKHLPSSTLVAIALMNEMDQEEPFSFNTDLDSVTYTPGQNTTNIKNVTEFLKYIGWPLDIENILCQRHFFDLTHDELLAVLKEMRDKELLAFVAPSSSSKFKYYPKGHQKIRLAVDGEKPWVNPDLKKSLEPFQQFLVGTVAVYHYDTYVCVRFLEKPDKETRDALRAYGFTWSRVLEVWRINYDHSTVAWLSDSMFRVEMGKILTKSKPHETPDVGVE